MKRLIILILLLSSCFAAEERPLYEEYRPPVLCTTAIIEMYDKEGDFQGIVLIEREKEPMAKAIPGGRVKYGESVEHAVRREVKEETDLDLHELRQFHVYSEPSRDPNWHTIDITYLAKAYTKKPQASDDVAETFIIPIELIPWDNLALDHQKILKDYLTYREGQSEISMPKP